MKRFLLRLMTLAWLLMALARLAVAEETPPLAKSPLEPEEAKSIQERWARHLGKEVVETNSLGMKMVLLPPGEFTMGRTEKQLETILAIVKYLRRLGAPADPSKETIGFHPKPKSLPEQSSRRRRTYN